MVHMSCGKNFNIAIFLDSINMINVKTHWAYPFMPLSVTLIVFQGHSSVKQFQLKIVCSYLIKLKLCLVVDYVK